MAQQTINVGAAPNDGTGTPLRTAFQYTNSNFSELYTAVGPSGNNIVVPGTATITGDLTVDTSTLKVDSGTNNVSIGGLVNKVTGVSGSGTGLTIQASAAPTLGIWDTTDPSYFTNLSQVDADCYLYNNAAGALLFGVGNSERYRIASDGVATWSNVGGTSGTAMTLNSNGLGVGTSPSTKLTVGAASPTLRLLDTNTAVNNGVYGTIDWLSSDSSMPGGLAAKIDVIDTATAGDRGAMRFFTNDGSSLAERLRIDAAGSLVLGSAAVATTATDGFLYIPSCAGAPTGVPTTKTGRVPMVVDSTNNRFYVYVSGTWKYTTLA